MRPLLFLLAAAVAGCSVPASPVVGTDRQPVAEPFALVGSAESLTEAEVSRLLGAAVVVRADGRFAVLQAVDRMGLQAMTYLRGLD